MSAEWPVDCDSVPWSRTPVPWPHAEHSYSRVIVPDSFSPKWSDWWSSRIECTLSRGFRCRWLAWAQPFGIHAGRLWFFDFRQNYRTPRRHGETARSHSKWRTSVGPCRFSPGQSHRLEPASLWCARSWGEFVECERSWGISIKLVQIEKGSNSSAQLKYLLMCAKTGLCFLHISQIGFPEFNVEDFDKTSLEQLFYSFIVARFHLNGRGEMEKREEMVKISRRN